jgi:hypothetical protein
MLVIKIEDFCILPCNNKKINDKLYFDNYEKTINKNPEAIRCIYEYLKTYDIEKVVPNKLFAGARPKSDLYLDLQNCNREKEWDFIENDVLNVPNDILEVTENTTDLWIKYKIYCNNNNYDISKTSSKSFHFLFTHNIIKHLNKNIKTKDAIIKNRTTIQRFYIFNIKKLKKYFEPE